MNWLMEFLAFSLSVFIVAQILPSVRIRGFGTAVVVALVYGVLKFCLRWLLVLLSLPLMIVSLGLFLIVINAFLLWITDKLIDDFEIDSFISTIIASVLISLLDIVLKWILPGV